MPKTKNAPNAQKATRITIAVIRGMPSYKNELKKKLENIEKNYNTTIPLEKFLERAINLALEEYGESALTGRLQGRYSEKS